MGLRHLVALEVVEQQAVGKGVEGDHVVVAAPPGPQQTCQYVRYLVCQ